MTEFVPILVSLAVSTALSMLVFGVSFVLGTGQQVDPEKVSAYECGFDPFDDARKKFDIRFYLVAILFIIFDLEVAFLFPWAITLHLSQELGFWAMMVFLAILTVGFVYEWMKGALDWE